MNKDYSTPKTEVYDIPMGSIITTSKDGTDIPKGGDTDEYDSKRRNFNEIDEDFML